MQRQLKFLIISDNTSYQVGGVRYLGPYRIAHELEAKGVKTYVLDRFYSFPNFFEFLENFMDNDFVGLGISTTFFNHPSIFNKYNRFSTRRARHAAYYQHGIISEFDSEREVWFRKIKEIINKKSINAKLFIGGTKAQFFYEDLYKNIQEIDYVVMGAVDGVFPEIILDTVNKGAPKYINIGNKKVIDTLNTYIQPKSCPKHQWKPHWCIQKKEALPIEIGRGCAFNCKFCNYDKKENTRKTLSDLKEEFIFNYENFETQFYHFVDDCFNDSRKKVDDVCNLILSLPFKIEWVSYARFDIALKYSYTSEVMVESGGRGFHWGVESLTQEVARKAGKGANSEEIKNFIMNFSKKYKKICYSTGSFISGLPGETEESWFKQLDWLINTDNFDFVQIGPLGIIPYKENFDGNVIDYADYSRNPKKYGFEEMNMETGYWRHGTCDYFQASEWSAKAMNLWQKKMENQTGLSSDTWLYPVLRSLDYSTDEIYELYKNTSLEVQEKLQDKGRSVHLNRLKNYHKEIRQLK